MTGVGSRHRPRRDWKPVAASVIGPRMSLVLQSFLPFPHSCQGPSPHQQGRDERMIEQCFGGIDVSQDRLDVLLLPQGTGFSVANNEAGWRTLIARLRGLLLTAIGLEPSGGYERGVLRALLAAGLWCVASIPTDFGSSPALASAKVWRRPICLSENGRTSARRTAIAPIASFSRIRGIAKMVRTPSRRAMACPSGNSSAAAKRSWTCTGVRSTKARPIAQPRPIGKAQSQLQSSRDAPPLLAAVRPASE